MSDLNLTSFNPLYPMRIHPYKELLNDSNVNIMDKVNAVIDYLNQVGKLTNDVVKDWNTVYQWVMNDGLTTDVNNKLEQMLANHEFDPIMNNILTKIGDLTTLQTTDKDTLVHAINDLVMEIGSLSSLQTSDKTSVVNAINANVASLAQKVSQVNGINPVNGNVTIAIPDSSTFAVKTDLKDIVYNITSYTSYKSGSDWYPAIVQAMNDLVSVGGGTLYFPKGTYSFGNTIQPPSNVRLLGAGKGITTLQMIAGTNKSLVRLVAGLQNLGLSHLTLHGNSGVGKNTLGSGLLLDGTGVPTANAAINGWVLEHVAIISCAEHGVYSIAPIWMYNLNEFEISFCGGHGLYITSSDNSYTNIAVGNCVGSGVYDSAGANNRYHNIKSIFNGNGSSDYLNTAGFYFNGSARHTITNCEAQENYAHGFVVNNSKNINMVGIVTDANGYKNIAVGGTPVAGDGIQILGSYNIDIHNLQCTNFKTQQTQNRPIYIDGACSDIMITHQQDYNNYTDSVILSNLNVSIKKNWDDLINQFKNGNNTLNNFILNGQFSGTSNWNLVGIASNSTSNGVLTFTANANFSRVSQTVSLTNGHLYYISGKVLTSLNAQNIFFNILKNSSPYPSYGITGAKGTGSWETLSNLFVMTDVTGNYELGVFDQRSSGWDAIQMKEVMIIDVTSILTNTGFSTAKTNKLAKTFDQIVINGGGWFQGVKNLGLDSRVSTLEQSKLNGATASRPTPQYVGQPFFDTTLGKPVYCKQISPAIWVDATGATV